MFGKDIDMFIVWEIYVKRYIIYIDENMEGNFLNRLVLYSIMCCVI